MTDEQRQYNHARHKADQAWARVREFIPDIERIAAHGPLPNRRDTAIVRLVFNTVLADLYIANYEAGTDAPEDPA